MYGEILLSLTVGIHPLLPQKSPLKKRSLPPSQLRYLTVGILRHLQPKIKPPNR
jgi:hypothetical protein